MQIGIIDVDGKIPNLALMKISRYHKLKGDNVEFCNYLKHYDIVYKAKVFTFTPEDTYVINADRIIKGGTGYDIHKKLPDYIDCLQPDYSLYPNIDKRIAYGFLTRGCPNHCKWCIVPEKEGNIKPYMDVDEIAIENRTHLILMDNNILACDYGINQIEKIIDKKYHVDFNQALDARLVDDEIAKLLSKIKWINFIRFGCDTIGQIKSCIKAMSLIDKYRNYPASYLLYMIIGSDINEAYKRLSYFRNFKRVRIVAQPYRDFNNKNQVIPQWQKDMARWAMRREIYVSCDFKDYQPRKQFICKNYFI